MNNELKRWEQKEDQATKNCSHLLGWSGIDYCFGKRLRRVKYWIKVEIKFYKKRIKHQNK